MPLPWQWDFILSGIKTFHSFRKWWHHITWDLKRSVWLWCPKWGVQKVFRCDPGEESVVSDQWWKAESCPLAANKKKPKSSVYTWLCSLHSSFKQMSLWSFLWILLMLSSKKFYYWLRISAVTGLPEGPRVHNTQDQNESLTRLKWHEGAITRCHFPRAVWRSIQ